MLRKLYWLNVNHGEKLPPNFHAWINKVELFNSLLALKYKLFQLCRVIWTPNVKWKVALLWFRYELFNYEWKVIVWKVQSNELNDCNKLACVCVCVWRPKWHRNDQNRWVLCVWHWKIKWNKGINCYERSEQKLLTMYVIFKQLKMADEEHWEADLSIKLNKWVQTVRAGNRTNSS